MARHTLVIGAGPNGLTAATLLAKAGHSVTILERRDVPGGVAAGETFHDGFTTTGLVHDSCHVRPGVIDALGLGSHGLTWRDMPALFGCLEDGPGLRLPRDPAGAKTAIATRDSAADHDGYARWLGKVKPLAKQLLENRAPAIGQTSDLWPLLKTALGVRMLGERDMMELLRIAPSCVDDWLEEHFPDPLVRAMVMGPALTGAWMGPRSPTSALCLIAYEALAGREVSGGPAALVAALVSAASAAGVTLRLGTEVTGITVAEGAVTGVTLADGTALAADAVVSAIGPRKTLLDLIDPLWLPPTETGDAQNTKRSIDRF